MASYRVGGVKSVTIAAVALVCVAIGFVGCNAPILEKLSNKLNGNERSEMSIKLKSNKVTAEKVHELLQAFSDKQARFGGYTVEQLLAMNEFSLDKCNQSDTFVQNTKMIDYGVTWDYMRNRMAPRRYAGYKGLLKYLKRCQKNLANYCLDNYVKVEQQALANLDEDDKKNIQRFMSKIADNRSSINYQVVEKAEAAYVESYKGSLEARYGDDAARQVRIRLDRSCVAVHYAIYYKTTLEGYADRTIEPLDDSSRLPEWQGVEQACKIYRAKLAEEARAEFYRKYYETC